MKKKKESRGFTWLRRLFLGPAKELNFLEEEQIQSPLRSMVKRFFSNKIAMTGLVVFMACLMLTLIGPIFLPLDLSYSDATQQNVPPTMSLAKLPDELKGDTQDVSVGTTYGIGCDMEGKVYTWGYTKVTDTIDIGDIPEEVQNAHIVKVAAGFDHAVALSDEGEIFV